MLLYRVSKQLKNAVIDSVQSVPYFTDSLDTRNVSRTYILDMINRFVALYLY